MKKAIMIVYLLSISQSMVFCQANELNREGVLFGVSFGLSQTKFDIDNAKSDSQSGLSLPNIKIGKSVNDQISVLLYLPGSVYKYELEGRTRNRGFEAVLPSIQYWPTDRIWLLGGLGLGMDAPAFFDIKTEEERRFHFGYAMALSSGYELIQFHNKTIDIQARIHHGVINTDDGKVRGTSFTILLGINLC